MFNSDVLKCLLEQEEEEVNNAILASDKEYPDAVEAVHQVRERLSNHLKFLLEYGPEDDSVDY